MYNKVCQSPSLAKSCPDLQNPSPGNPTSKLQSQLPQPDVFTAAPCVSKVSASDFLLALTTSKSGEPDVLLTSSLGETGDPGPRGEGKATGKCMYYSSV